MRVFRQPPLGDLLYADLHVVSQGRLVDDFPAVVCDDPVNALQLVRLDNKLEAFSGPENAKT